MMVVSSLSRRRADNADRVMEGGRTERQERHIGSTVAQCRFQENALRLCISHYQLPYTFNYTICEVMCLLTTLFVVIVPSSPKFRKENNERASSIEARLYIFCACQ